MTDRRGAVIQFKEVLVLLFLLSSLVSAQTTISDIQYNLLWGDAFTSQQQSFFLSEDYSGTGTTVTGIMQASGDSEYNYEIRGGSITFADSQLLENFSSDGIAAGLFDSGAEVLISGSIWNIQTEQFIYSGALIAGTVQSEFVVFEDEWSPDTLYSQMSIHVTGGELLNGNQAGMRLMDNHLVADISLIFCTQKGKEVKDFGVNSGDISYLQGSMMQMYAAPEPLTVLFFSIGSFFALRIRKK